MPTKEAILSRLKQERLVAIIRTDNRKEALRITEAILDGGLAAIEVSFTMPDTPSLLAELAKKYTPSQLLLGAGTVLDPETARIAILAGAQYIISPYLNVETVKLCLRYQVPCIPGAMTVRETMDCLEAGADMVKIFPAELFGPKIIKVLQELLASRSPLPYAPLIPTGGVTVANLEEWFQAGALAVGVGGAITAGAKTGDYQAITEIARQFKTKIDKLKSEAFF
ncbi:MAG: bifunctional 2-keto-4-hydroxyglutarate aldolase/2-keto-3-deoxy-6-phosphogluconate aldolase [Firmicutes bacterium]|nr:bifunctional 2-keto-4-hydroxyglutarate aldolase/2-keto-3-deoxy-6-phosphogluconate aldolase [Bacillota bacterium]